LNEKDVAALTLRGFVRFVSGDLDGAFADSARAIKLDGKAADAFQVHGSVQLLRGRWLEAAADFRDAGLHSEAARASARLLLWVSRARAGERAGADQELEDYLSLRSEADWNGILGQYLLGQHADAELIAAATETAPDAEMERAQQCQANYYVAVLKDLKGDGDGARDFFQQCVATGMTFATEFHLAKAELAKMDASGAGEKK
jgi:lipoprotein NlpI